MGVTAIKRLENRSRFTVTLINVENRNAPGSGVAVAPRGQLAMDSWIPWATSGDFAAKHLQVQFDGVTRFWVWQAANADGDHVRVSVDGRWHDRGEPVDGISAADGDRTLVVFDTGVQLVHLPDDLVALLRGVLSGDRYQLVRSARLAAPSVPKLTATTFSVPGFASDTVTPVYRDTGKRYEFQVEGGVVIAIHPDGQREPLPVAVSYDERRVGVRGTAPPFDLIAASGGRVLAKARDDDRFYFLAMDETFVHRRPSRGDFVVPSTYFKLDPEANRAGASIDDVTRPISGAFGQHPAAERFPLFRTLLASGLMDMMVVAVEPRVWHLLDPRPPVGLNNVVAAALGILAERIAPLLPLPWPEPLARLLRAVKGELERRALVGRESDIAPPPGYPTYEHVVHRAQSGAEMKLRSVQFRRVLDIGVGHVNWHEQYSGVTGGEIQPMLHFEPWATLYRFVAGPVRDGDGYIDGTCNFYALVELGDPAGAAAGYALLYMDEQSYFTQRWRVVDPADRRGLMFALVTDLDLPFYGFDRAKYWSPFKAGLVGPASRLAVAAQVLLVTGDARAEPQRRRIYSTNFSWSSTDRSWRWRELPASAEVRHFDAAATAAGTEPIAAAARDTVYPQTIRLREDMTLHLKGTRARPGQPVETGRWYQRYLPSANRPVPGPEGLVAGGPPLARYTHAWKFLPEDAWSRADRFSHLGVYDAVDSRSQYYEVTPAGDADARALAETGGDGWVDHELRLSRWAPKLSWAAPLHILTPTNLVPGVLDRRPASLYNRETRMRIVRRNGRWIAMHWDKRDDELLPLLAFDIVPATLTFAAGTRRATVTLGPHRRLEEPPAVQRAELRWSGESGEPASIVLRPPPERPDLAGTLWRVRIAALASGVVRVLDVETAGALTPVSGGAFEYRWTPPEAQATALRTYCAELEAPRWATSLWVENIVGQVAMPEEVAWVRTAPLTLIVDRTISVPEASALVDTGIDLEPGDDFAFDAGGQIKSGVLFTSWNGPQGWTNVDHDAKFPLHEGPDAHPFALIGRFDGLPWFYVGPQRGRTAYGDGPRRRLHLRTNDDAPGNGEGAFTCRVRVWRVLARSSRFVSQSMPAQLVAGASADAEIRMRNAGTATWTPQAGFRLGTEDPRWGPARVELPGPVPTGAEALCRFRITAPAAPGVHRVSWRMLQEGVEWFGPASPPVEVLVTSAGEPAECASLRAQRQEHLEAIADLEAELAGLPPRAGAPIRAAITSHRTQIAALEQRMRELGCSP